MIDKHYKTKDCRDTQIEDEYISLNIHFVKLAMLEGFFHVFCLLKITR